ncbi:MAG: hypothetical protein Q7S02_03195 [bacterium]|nr:hypothetical protein [bacterium]
MYEAAFFAIGTFWFWTLAVIASIILLVTAEYEKPGWATITCIATGVILAFFGDFNVLTETVEHPLTALAVFGGYIVVGVLWSFGKWWFYVHRLKREYVKERNGFLKGHHATSMSQALKTRWRENNQYRQFPPKAKNHRSRILTWMMYWPWSAVWTLINDPIRRLFREIFEWIQGIYEHIVQRAFADVADDFRFTNDVPVPSEDTEHDE